MDFSLWIIKSSTLYLKFIDSISHDIKDKSVVKDGIHIIISLHMEHNAQMLLRDEVIAMVKDNQPLEIEGQINSYDQIFDSSTDSSIILMEYSSPFFQN